MFSNEMYMQSNGLQSSRNHYKYFIQRKVTENISFTFIHRSADTIAVSFSSVSASSFSGFDCATTPTPA